MMRKRRPGPLEPRLKSLICNSLKIRKEDFRMNKDLYSYPEIGIHAIINLSFEIESDFQVELSDDGELVGTPIKILSLIKESLKNQKTKEENL